MPDAHGGPYPTGRCGAWQAAQVISRSLRRGTMSADSLSACAFDPALPSTTAPRLPGLLAALLADSTPAVAAHGGRLAVSLIAAASTARLAPFGASASASRRDASREPPSLSTAASVTLSRQSLSEVLSALFGAPRAAAAAAAALSELATHHSTTLADHGAMLHDTLTYAPRLPPHLCPPLFASLAAVRGSASKAASSGAHSDSLLARAYHLGRGLLFWESPPIWEGASYWGKGGSYSGRALLFGKKGGIRTGFGDAHPRVISAHWQAVAYQPSLRPPLLLFIQKHAFALGGRAPGHGATGLAADDDDATALATAVDLSAALLQRPGALGREERSTIVSWLLRAAPLASGRGAALSWRLLGRCVALL